MGQKEYGNDGIFSSLVSDSMHSRLRRMFGLDLRALAMFRVFMAACVIGDLMERSLDLKAHYSDLGIIPRHVMMERWGSGYNFVIHAINGSVEWQAFVFLLHGLFALSFMIGYRTRLMNFLTWFFLLSLQSHNVAVGHGGDVFFRLMLFYGMFLPLGECFSVDSAYFDSNRESKAQTKGGSGQDSPYLVSSVATFGLIFQISAMYMFSVYHKTGAEWNQTYTATFYALQLDYFRTPFGDIFLQFPELLKFLTWAVKYWELFGPLCYIAPIFTPYFRMLGVLGFVALHAGFGSCLRLGLFYWVTTCAQFGLVPSELWDWVMNRLRTRDRLSLRVYYNPTSGLSEHLALTLKTFFLIPKTKVRALNDESEPMTMFFDEKPKTVDSEFNAPGSVVVQMPSYAPTGTSSVPNVSGSKDCWLLCIDHSGKQNTDFVALVTVMQHSPLLWPLAALLRKSPEFITNLVEDTIDFLHAKYKYQAPTVTAIQTGTYVPPLHMRRRHSPRPTGITMWDVARNLAVAFIIIYVISWNMGNIGHHEFRVIPHSMNWFGWLTRIDQSWGMFSPHPPKAHWWYVIKANLDDGREVEIFKNEGMFKWEPNAPFSFDKPKPFHTTFGNHRWFKYYEHGYNSQNPEPFRLAFGRYICREYNARHSGADMLYTFKVYFVIEQQNLDGTRDPYTTHEVWSHLCYDKKH